MSRPWEEILRHLIRSRPQVGTVEALALQSGVAYSRILAFLDGSRHPDFREAVAMTKTLGCSLDYLFGPHASEAQSVWPFGDPDFGTDIPVIDTLGLALIRQVVAEMGILPALSRLLSEYQSRKENPAPCLKASCSASASPPSASPSQSSD